MVWYHTNSPRHDNCSWFGCPSRRAAKDRHSPKAGVFPRGRMTPPTHDWRTRSPASGPFESRSKKDAADEETRPGSRSGTQRTKSSAPPNKAASARRTRRVVPGKIGAGDQRVGLFGAPLVGGNGRVLPLSRLPVQCFQTGSRDTDRICYQYQRAFCLPDLLERDPIRANTPDSISLCCTA
jgi:hypothetical protein